MIVLGIGGLHNAVPVKREVWPAFTEDEYRTTQRRDSANMDALFLENDVGTSRRRRRLGSGAERLVPVEANL